MQRLKGEYTTEPTGRAACWAVNGSLFVHWPSHGPLSVWPSPAGHGRTCCCDSLQPLASVDWRYTVHNQLNWAHSIAVPSVTRCRCRCRGHRCGGDSSDTWWMGVRRLAVANGPNIFQMLLVYCNYLWLLLRSLYYASIIWWTILI